MCVTRKYISFGSKKRWQSFLTLRLHKQDIWRSKTLKSLGQQKWWLLNHPHPTSGCCDECSVKDAVCETHVSHENSNECHEVQNPQRHHISAGKWPTVRMAFNGGSAGSLQRSCFSENPTNLLTFVARWVRDIIFRMNSHSRGEMWLNRHTNTHIDPTTVTLLRMCAEG